MSKFIKIALFASLFIGLTTNAMEEKEENAKALVRAAGEGNIEKFQQLLIKDKKYINARTHLEEPQFSKMQALGASLHCAIYNGNNKIVKSIINNDNANLNISMHQKYARGGGRLAINIIPLMVAAGCNNYKALKWLLNKKQVNSNAQDSNGKTALFYAIGRGNCKTIGLLVNHIDINIQDMSGSTALHYACLFGHKNVAQLLINCGADCKILNNRGKCPLDLARQQNQIDILNSEAIKYGSRFRNALFNAIKLGDYEEVKALSQCMAFEVRDAQGNTPLHKAILEGNADLAELICHVTPKHLLAKNKSGKTPIYLAATFCHDFLQKRLTATE